MPFNSYQFLLLFIPTTLAGYWAICRYVGTRAGLGVVMLASLFFYAHAGLRNLFIIGGWTCLNYLVGMAMLHQSRPMAGSRLIAVGIAGNLCFLGYFKYQSSVLDGLDLLLSAHFNTDGVIVPLGVSFITFQMISFLVDVHSGQISKPGFAPFLLFTFFFPRVVAGPLVQYNQLVPQFVTSTSNRLLNNLAVAAGLISMGLFKKSVVADGLGDLVAPVFDLPVNGPPLTALDAWTGTLAFTLQIYFDFSGYSDMALGLARLFGIQLPINFNSPLKARSIIEFWSRWHITLTRFLTSYVYTPIVLHLSRARLARGRPLLQGKRSRPSAVAELVAAPVMMTMAISGLWHGAGWQFLVWGLLHGSFLTINHTWRLFRPRLLPDQKKYNRLMVPLGLALTLTAVTVSFVFFRAASVPAALAVLHGMSGANGILPPDLQLMLQLGVPVSGPFWWATIVSSVWIIVLLLSVLLLPNSMELLRYFKPALDFPADSLDPAHIAADAQVTGRGGDGAGVREWLIAKRWGTSMQRIVAVTTAVLFVLGAMSMQRGGAFLYWKF